MYALSLVLLLASVVALLLGLRQGGLTLIFVSMGCSALAALFLGASVLRGASTEETAAGSSVKEWRGRPSGGRPS